MDIFCSLFYDAFSVTRLYRTEGQKMDAVLATLCTIPPSDSN
jgi:hypothetical protein